MSVSIAAVGDISLGDHPVCVGHGMRKTFFHRKEEVLKCAEKHLKSSDFAIANLETVTSDMGFSSFWLPSYEMRGDPSSLDYLKNAGFSVLGVANNHAMQHGTEAFHDTVASLKTRGFEVIGVDNAKGNTAVFSTTKNGVKFNIFALSLRPEEWHDEAVPYSYRDNKEEILKEVKALRKNNDGFLICSLHWGLEFIDEASPFQVDLGHALIESGVDVILGHHSHVLQPVEYYKNGLIFYSLGNFCFDLWLDSTKLTGIARLELEHGEKPLYHFEPMVISSDFTLREASEQESKKIKSIMDKEVSGFRSSDYTKLQIRYEKRYLAASKMFRYSSYKYFLRKSLKYPLHFFLQSLVRTILRRITGT